jgi:hypothetical protein
LLLSVSQLILKGLNAFLQQFPLRLHVSGLNVLVLDQFLNLRVALALQLLQTTIGLALHISDNSLVHGNYFVQRTCDAISFLLEVAHLISKQLVLGLELSAPTSLLFYASETVGLAEEDIVGQLAGSVGELAVGSLAELLGRKALNRFQVLFAPAAVEQFVHLI